MTKEIDFVVRKDDLRVCRFTRESPAKGLKEGQVELRVERFAFTANNITYAVYGEAMGYWDFYPADDGWGRVPVWGFAQVVNSANGDIEVGERYYGFLPMSSSVILTAKLNPIGFREESPHRASLPGAYNQYFSTQRDPGYDPHHENEQMILRPLFITSFLAFDFLEHNNFFEARSVVISSASSKTAYGLAFLLSQVADLDVIGLTSSKNEGFTRELGCYDRVLNYDSIGSLPNEAETAYVDIAGSTPVRAALRERLKDKLVYSMAVGDTHWQQDNAKAALADQQEFFFAPTWLSKRAEDWGMDGFSRRLAEAWIRFKEPVGRWMKVVEETGPEAVERVYFEHLDGVADPSIGNILSLD